MTNCIVLNNKNNSDNDYDIINSSPSKSQTLRAILFATIASGESIITNILNSPDTHSMIQACELLGAKINFLNNNTLSIIGTSGKLKNPDDIINAGNSGIVFRFIASLGIVLDKYLIITGDDSIKNNRPIQGLLTALNQLGVTANSILGDGRAPIIIKGPALFNNTTLDGSDSQPVSGLIIASILRPGKTIINVTNPGEKPWIDLTLEWLDKFNIKYSREDYYQYIIHGNNNIQAFDYQVPADLSSISFPIAAAIITNSPIIINNIDLSDLQGDKIILEIFNKIGANIEYDNNKIIVNKNNSNLTGINIDINNCIDALSIIAVVACYARGKTVITGAKIARTKECDRITAITTELKKMGANIKENPDGIEIIGSELTASNNLITYRDHRMVMSLFIAALGAQGKSVIEDVSSVNKSYPNFFMHMQELKYNFNII